MNNLELNHPKTIIATTQAPLALGPYSQAIRLGNWLYTAGQIPLRPGESTIQIMAFDEQVHQVFQNLSHILKAAGGQLGDVVKFTIFMTDLKQFSILNRVMQEYVSPPFPARSTVEVRALPQGAQVEIEAIAYLTDAE